MRYKKLYEQQKRELDNLKYEIEMLRIEKKEFVKEIDQAEGFRKALEGREISVVKENQWLKDTLRLVIVDAGKMSELAKHIEEERRIWQGF